MPKLVLGYIGPNASGKTTATEITKEECLGAESFRFSTPLRECQHCINELVPITGTPREQREAYAVVLKKVYGEDIIERGLVISPNPLHRFQRRMKKFVFPLVERRENLQRLSTDIRQIFGEDTFARRMVRDVMASTALVVIVEGIRRRGDMLALQQMKNFFTAFIDTTLERCYEWSVPRKENVGDDVMTFTEFKRAGRREAEREIASLIHEADVVIRNNGTKEELVRSVRSLVREKCEEYGV